MDNTFRAATVADRRGAPWPGAAARRMTGFVAGCALALAAAGAQAQTFYNQDGITLAGTARIVTRGAGVCQVLEERHAPAVYERMRANDGQPLNVWRLDFAARNGSGRRLQHLTAHVNIAAEWPPCTTWSGPEGSYAKTVQWASSLESLQEPDGMEPGEEVSDTVFVLAFHDHEPRFEKWDIDYRFAEGPAAAQPPATAASAEQETVFWQSIMNSTNPAEFQAYLAQFPGGVFRALAEARLAARGTPAPPRAGWSLRAVPAATYGGLFSSGEARRT